MADTPTKALFYVNVIERLAESGEPDALRRIAQEARLLRGLLEKAGSKK